MTQQNGVWSDIIMSRLNLTEGVHNDPIISLKDDLKHQNSYSSHLEQILENEKLKIKIELVFLNGNSSIQRFTIKNKTKFPLELNTSIQGGVYKDIGIEISKTSNQIKLVSRNTDATGYITINDKFDLIDIGDENSFYSFLKHLELKSNESKSFVISQSFIFPEYSWEDEQKLIASVDFDSVLNARKSEKNQQLKSLIDNRKSQFQDSIYAEVLAKAQLTLQNNWRIPAGEIEHEGLFPSYHYRWFNGFWSWDSWKHSVGLSYYNLPLAKEQIKLMFKFQNDDGFVADCVYRDTTIEAHNYRDTKPPFQLGLLQKSMKKTRI